MLRPTSIPHGLPQQTKTFKSSEAITLLPVLGMNLTVNKWLARAVLFAALTTIDVFLARFAVLMPSAPGVAGLYFAVAFMVASSI